MNKKTLALTTEQYREIISTMREGFTGVRPNPRIAAALMLEANLGLRISDWKAAMYTRGCFIADLVTTLRAFDNCHSITSFPLADLNVSQIVELINTNCKCLLRLL